MLCVKMLKRFCKNVDDAWLLVSTNAASGALSNVLERFELQRLQLASIGKPKLLPSCRVRIGHLPLRVTGNLLLHRPFRLPLLTLGPPLVQPAAVLLDQLGALVLK